MSSIRPACLAFLLPAALIVTIAPTARADLDAYLKKPDPSYRWENGPSADSEQGQTFDLELVSQTWQGIPWKHNLRVYVPRQVEHPDAMLLFIVGGSHTSTHDKEDDALAFALARLCRARVAVLPQVPNQPLLGDKKEDTLIAETFVRYLDTGDPDWPLLFPMVKSAHRAMDALQEWAVSGKHQPVKKFVVTGASKRGWTTWLTGATDPRVVAIAPMVIDVLNFPAQKEGWQRAYGGPSEQVADYTERGLIQIMDRPEGRELWGLVDPINFRDRLKLPKLVVLGSNDPYWTVDALNLYWDQLEGPKSVVYLPNAGHGLEENRGYALAGIAAAFRRGVANQAIPPLEWTHRDNGNSEAILDIKPPSPPKQVRVWVARSDSLDFRKSRWEPQTVSAQSEIYEFHLAVPDSGHTAFFGDVEFDGEGAPYHLSTQIRVVGPRGQ